MLTVYDCIKKYNPRKILIISYTDGKCLKTEIGTEETEELSKIYKNKVNKYNWVECIQLLIIEIFEEGEKMLTVNEFIQKYRPWTLSLITYSNGKYVKTQFSALNKECVNDLKAFLDVKVYAYQWFEYDRLLVLSI